MHLSKGLGLGFRPRVSESGIESRYVGISFGIALSSEPHLQWLGKELCTTVFLFYLRMLFKVYLF